VMVGCGGVDCDSKGEEGACIGINKMPERSKGTGNGFQLDNRHWSSVGGANFRNG